MLTLTSSSTLHRPHCLKSRTSSGYIAIRLERHQGHSSRSLVAHFLLCTGHAALRVGPAQATSPFGLNATKATAPGAQLLTLTSSSTLHRPRCLKSRTSSGYIAIRLERHQGHSSRSPVAHFLLCTGYAASRVGPAQATSPFGSNATKATAPGAQLLTLTSSSTLHRPRCLKSQTSSGCIAIRLERHQGHITWSPVAHIDELFPSVHSDELFPSIHMDELYSTIHIDELSPSVHMDELYSTIHIDKLFPSVHLDELYSTVHIDELFPSVHSDELFPSVHMDELLLNCSL